MRTLKQESPRAAEKAIKARCLTDRRFFAKFFFAEKLSHGFSRFHLETFAEPKTAFRDRAPMSGWRRARMVPRGNGKTTTRVRIEAIHDVVYGLEPFIVIIAEQQDLSRQRLREIRLELERNKRLRRFYGDLKGEVWQADNLETTTGITISAKSMRGQVRGITNPLTNERPTKVYLDDAEHSRDVLNPEIRLKTKATFHEDIEAGGTTDGRTCFQFTGTPLHREAQLPSLRENAAWDFRAYSAIEKWPARMDLWERCRQIFASAGAADDDADGRPAAAPEAVNLAWQFYQANRKRMDEGARVLWPEGEPLFALMVFRWTNGEAAFSKEKMLVPRDPGLATFEMESDEYPRRGALRHVLSQDRHGPCLIVDTRDGRTRKVSLSRLRFVSFHDPAKADPKASRSKKSLGDYAAITVMGIEDMPGRTRIGHIVDAWLEREPPSEQVSRHFELADHWKISTAIVEQDTLALLRKVYRDEAERRRKAHLFSQLPLRSLEQQVTNKDARIAAMEPAVVNGWITYNRSLPQAYWHQWVDHPTGDHDDGPDSAEGCWRYRGRKSVGLRVVSL